MKSRECPRCNEQRLIEWFGDPKAPYAICLRCRIEVNGETKQKKVVKQRSRNCAICSQVLLGATREETCDQCEAGLRIFNHSHVLLGRAASYVGGTLRKPKKQRRRFKVRNQKLGELIKQQRRDDKERGLRFDHAITK
jgi:hypothetical protein